MSDVLVVVRRGAYRCSVAFLRSVPQRLARAMAEAAEKARCAA